MSITYSPICDSSETAYLAYLAAVSFAVRDGSGDERFGRQHGQSGEGRGGCCDNHGVGSFVAAVVRCLEGGNSTARCASIGGASVGVEDSVGGGVDCAHTASIPTGGLPGGDLGGDECIGYSGQPDALFIKVPRRVEDASVDDGPVGRGSSAPQVITFGKNHRRNVKSRERRKRQALRSSVPEWRRSAVPVGSCETVVSDSSCPSYGRAVSDAEREAKDSLARRRVAENAVAEKLAKLKMASLEDEKKCEQYAALKSQRILQWHNEATAKSQQCLEKCKSIDPGSSASQYDIRMQAKKLADVQYERDQFERIIYAEVTDAREKIDAARLPGTATMEDLEFQGRFLGAEVESNYEF